MKKLAFLLLLFGSLSLNAQTFKFSFLGDDFLLYKGSLLKVKNDALSTGFTHTFYNSLERCQAMFDNNVIYPDSKYTFKTVKDSLINRIFKVDNIIDKQGNELNAESKLLGGNKPIFVLKDTANNQIIYFKYDKDYDFNFPFESSGIVYSKDLLCSGLERKVDDFTDKITISSPLLSGNRVSPMIIYKTISKGVSLYYLSLNTSGSTVNVNKTGVNVLFDDGTKWNRQSKVDVEATSDGFEYSSFIKLTQNDLIVFSKKRIKKFRLYIYDEDVNYGEAEKFKSYVDCIRTAK